MVLAYNRTKATEVSDIDPSLAPYKSVRKLKTLLALMDYIDEPETVIETIKEFEINSPSELSNLKSAGVNPLIELGLIEE